MSAIDDLSDECFSAATRLIAELCTEFEDEIGEKPTIAELCEILCWGIRSCSEDILRDIHVENLIALKPKVSRRRKVVLTPGDVIAIPAADGACFLTVYLGLFRVAGNAMGLLEGRHPCGRLASAVKAIPVARPIFFHKLGITSGRWVVVGHRADWLALFPNPPEYYYAKRYYPHNEQIGRYGSARTVQDFNSLPGEDGTLRQLSEAEARTIGLLSDSFFQSGLVEQVEAYLHRLLETERYGHNQT